MPTGRSTCARPGLGCLAARSRGWSWRRSPGSGTLCSARCAGRRTWTRLATSLARGRDSCAEGRAEMGWGDPPHEGYEARVLRDGRLTSEWRRETNRESTGYLVV